MPTLPNWSFNVTPRGRQLLGLDTPADDPAALRRELNPAFGIQISPPASAVRLTTSVPSPRVRDLIHLARQEDLETADRPWVLLAPAPRWDRELTQDYLTAAQAHGAVLVWASFIDRPAFWPPARTSLTVAEFRQLAGFEQEDPHG